MYSYICTSGIIDHEYHVNIIMHRQKLRRNLTILQHSYYRDQYLLEMEVYTDNTCSSSVCMLLAACIITQYGFKV